MLGYIYAIRSPQTTKIYIGCTINSLNERFSGHLSHYKAYINKTSFIYCSSYNIIKYGDSYIEKLTDVEYIDYCDLLEKEKEVIFLFRKWVVNIDTINGYNMPEPNADSKQVYGYHWAYLKDFITDISNANQTMKELNSITTTVKGYPVSIYTKRNYMSALLHQIRDRPDLKKEYQPFNRELKDEITKISKNQECSVAMKQKLKDLTWADILQYKDEIVGSKAISTENKLLIRLYTELQFPVRNDFANITIFIDKPRPATFNGNCMMLTHSPIKKVSRKKVVINKTVVLSDDESADVEFYPVRNIIWLNDFKTSKHEGTPDIIQSIPDQLANDIIQYCKEKGTGRLFRASTYSLSNRIRAMFYQVSRRKIGINVLRHLKIMDEYKDTPMLHARKQTANMMGHSVDMQERYRLKLD